MSIAEEHVRMRRRFGRELRGRGREGEGLADSISENSVGEIFSFS